ncbi:MAG: hypothetical protein WCP01_16955 [Methylococcaceae bacterium]
MNTNTQTEQTTQPVMDDLTKQFAQVCFLYGGIINHDKVSKDTEISRFRWLADEATNLADLAMRIYTERGC